MTNNINTKNYREHKKDEEKNGEINLAKVLYFSSLCDQIKITRFDSIWKKENCTKNSYDNMWWIKWSTFFYHCLKKSWTFKRMPCRHLIKVKQHSKFSLSLRSTILWLLYFHQRNQGARLKVGIMVCAKLLIVPNLLDFMRYNCKINGNTLSFIQRFILLFQRRRNMQFHNNRPRSSYKRESCKESWVKVLKPTRRKHTHTHTETFIWGRKDNDKAEERKSGRAKEWKIVWFIISFW